jgi:pimeloyl-ACP methyl ester carboxylesterase
MTAVAAVRPRHARLTGDAEPRHGSVLSVSKTAFHRIAYTEWGDPQARRLVLCLHGLTRQGRDFDVVALALAEQGYRVVCPDLVGRGRSDLIDDPEEYNLPQYIMDMVVLLGRFEYDTLDWIGTSLGGLTGIVAAGIGRTPINRLILNDIGPYVAWQALYRLGSYLRQVPAEFPNLATADAYYRKTYAPFGNLSDDEWHHLVRHSVERTPHGTYRRLCDPEIGRAFNPAMLFNLTLWKYWDAITCPTLVLRGEQSDLLLRATAQEMTRRGPKARVGIITQWMATTAPR